MLLTVLGSGYFHTPQGRNVKGDPETFTKYKPLCTANTKKMQLQGYLLLK